MSPILSRSLADDRHILAIVVTLMVASPFLLSSSLLHSLLPFAYNVPPLFSYTSAAIPSLPIAVPIKPLFPCLCVSSVFPFPKDFSYFPFFPFPLRTFSVRLYVNRAPTLHPFSTHHTIIFLHVFSMHASRLLHYTGVASAGFLFILPSVAHIVLVSDLFLLPVAHSSSVNT